LVEDYVEGEGKASANNNGSNLSHLVFKRRGKGL